MIKKFLAMFLGCAMLFCATSCGKNKYEPIKSTSEELKTVMTLSLDGEKYNIPYELYRAFFLQLKSSVDGGNSDLWSGAEKDDLVKEIDKMILSRICEIYSVLHHAKKLGIDPYSDEIDDLTEEYITASIEGGSLGNTIFEGFDGDYDAYLASLKAIFLNYSVSDLFIRYTLVLNKLTQYYQGDPNSNDPAENAGNLSFTKEDVKAFYDGEGSVRMIRAFLPAEAFSEQRATEIRDNAEEKSSDQAVAAYLIQYTLSGGEDVKNGEVIGLYTLDKRYYDEITAVAFALRVGETGKLIKLRTENEEGYVIIYRAEKSDEHFEKCYDSIAYSYVENEIGKMLSDTEAALAESASYTAFLNSLDRASISMD